MWNTNMRSTTPIEQVRTCTQAFICSAALSIAFFPSVTLAQTDASEAISDSAASTMDRSWNDVFVVNGSNWSVLIRVTPKSASLELQGSEFVLAPGKTMTIARYSEGQAFVSPVEMMTVSGTVTNRRGKTRTIGVLMMEKRQPSKDRRAYYYHVMPGGGGFGVSF